jgi:putative DNA primase/helicase
MKVDVVEMARGRWHYILPMLGVDQKFLTKKNGPCPMCGGKDRFRFTDFQGEGRYYCTQCGPGDGFDLSGKVTGKKFPEIRDCIMRISGSVRPVVETVDVEGCIKAAAERWKKGRTPPVDGPVHTYLRQRLGAFPANVENIRQYEGNLIARVSGAMGGGVNIQTIELKTEAGRVIRGEKKVMKGVLPKGSAIRLAEPVGGVLGIAEGVETALSAWGLFGVPTWSVISTTGMVNWTPPEDVHTVIVFGDNDENFAGQSAAYSIANKLVTQFKKRAEVRIPPIESADWNDVLKIRLNSGHL